MLTVNLLPVTERTCSWVTQRVAIAAFMGLFMLAGCLFTYNSYQIWFLEKQVAAVRQQHELLRPAQEKLQLTLAQQRILAEKNSRLIKITAERRSWKSLLTHLEIIAPSQIWFSELSTGENNTLFVRGNALAYPDLATFIAKLEQDEYLSEPVLLKTEQDSQFAFTRFELTVKIKGI